MRPITGFGATLAALMLAITMGGSAGATSDRRARTSPTSLSLPDGFQPEGIAIGPGPFAFIGSMADGSLYRADLRTGRGAIISRGPGTPSLGMKTDPRGRLFVAGGTGDDARCGSRSPGIWCTATASTPTASPRLRTVGA
ncbi:hypothetical protein ACIBO2_33750 [Nonomuraea sp. NPDC050022]|uniref:hypothetical protein n=1 Tax=Nonomuraea sp. NPDC050022 TaxID=3364358 RepID=UPI0037B8E340